MGKAEKRELRKKEREAKNSASNAKLIAATPTQGPRITVAEDGEDAFLNWSFQFVQDGWTESELTPEQAAELMSGLVSRSKLTWSQVNIAYRYGLGTERISTDQLHVGIIPAVLPVDYVLVFRERGLFRLAGFRSGQTFYVLYIDPNGKLYDH